ncbi:hypothetical protein AX16_005192 [Volvariella volvacea WC 439]|nr:hypothetical protein AX16_005192 [Volvariella volvacea WC 439]
MKREADRQLTKDDSIEEGSQEEQQPVFGFKKADEVALASRMIRPLPRSRVLAGAAAPTPPSNSQNTTNGIADSPISTAPKFGGFGGFGSATASNHSFSFSLPSTTASTTTSTSSSPISSSLPSHFSFTATNTTPSFPSVVSSSTPDTVKPFASFLGTASSPTTTATPSSLKVEAPLEKVQKPPSPPPPKATAPTVLTTPPSKHITIDADVKATKYYTSLRGLNISLLEAVSNALEADPFVDATSLLEQYQKLRLEVQKEFDTEPNTSAPLRSLDSTPDSKPAPSMPAPPTSFAGFSFSTATSKSSSSGGFTPTGALSSAPSPFTFPPPKPADNTSSPSILSFPLSTPSSNPFALKSSADASKPSNPFSFAPSIATTEDGSMSAKSTNGTAPSGLFPLPGPSSSSNLSGQGDAPKAPPAFGGFTGFGKPTSVTLGSTSASLSAGFKFGVPAAPVTKTPDGARDDESEGKNTEEGNGSSSENKEAQPGLTLLGHSPHDEEGEGEEDEITVHSVKVKAYRWRKEEEGGAGWAELGAGQLRLKKHRESEKRRLLLRNSASGKININFNIYEGFKASVTKKAVTFTGHDAGVSRTYSVRAATEAQAQELKDAINREAAAVTAPGS